MLGPRPGLGFARAMAIVVVIAMGIDRDSSCFSVSMLVSVLSLRSNSGRWCLPSPIAPAFSSFLGFRPDFLALLTLAAVDDSAVDSCGFL